jgi:hypothetical protein
VTHDGAICNETLKNAYAAQPSTPP